jgi:secreted Zn-dependent insulinase-like peptidase
VRDQAARVLYAALLSDHLQEALYPAQMAGLGFSLMSFDRGLLLSVTGFDDKQSDVLAALVHAVQSFDVDPASYARLHDEVVRSGINSARIMPFRRLVNGVPEALLPMRWSGEALSQAAKPLSFEDVRAYGQQFLANVTVDMLAYGNYNQTHWADLMTAVQPLVTSDAALPLYRPRGLKAGAREVEKMPVLHDDAAVLRYIASETPSMRETALFALTGQVLEADFFHQLRTEQQLGYAVYAAAYPVLQYPGMLFLVQSPTHDAAAINQAMDAFMASALQQVDQHEFERHRASLVGRYREPPTNLREMSDQLWNERMIYQDARFDRRALVADQIERIQFDEWKRFVQRAVVGPERRELTLYAPGKAGVAP